MEGEKERKRKEKIGCIKFMMWYDPALSPHPSYCEFSPGTYAWVGGWERPCISHRMTCGDRPGNKNGGLLADPPGRLFGGHGGLLSPYVWLILPSTELESISGPLTTGVEYIYHRKTEYTFATRVKNVIETNKDKNALPLIEDNLPRKHIPASLHSALDRPNIAIARCKHRRRCRETVLLACINDLASQRSSEVEWRASLARKIGVLGIGRWEQCTGSMAVDILYFQSRASFGDLAVIRGSAAFAVHQQIRQKVCQRSAGPAFRTLWTCATQISHLSPAVAKGRRGIVRLLQEFEARASVLPSGPVGMAVELESQVTAPSRDVKRSKSPFPRDRWRRWRPSALNLAAGDEDEVGSGSGDSLLGYEPDDEE
ncbi:hypothetical protein BKA70DRAFT_1221707 [Coprinopsis sp. MPI-PUGE-AT-0042]|nr:hypothetical protein BKA70DRAFT_1221707 [Coprinopsis sp. MPI-PUGE-AT-0042]